MLGLLLLAADSLPAARAQPFEIEAWSIDGGGGTSTGGGFNLHGRIGQPDAGLLAGGGFTVIGGFPGFHVVPAGPVTLTIQLLGNGQVLLSWPAEDPGWVLETAPSLTPAAVWQAVTTPVATNYSAVPSSPARFFRLRRP